MRLCRRLLMASFILFIQRILTSIFITFTLKCTSHGRSLGLDFYRQSGFILPFFSFHDMKGTWISFDLNLTTAVKQAVAIALLDILPRDGLKCFILLSPAISFRYTVCSEMKVTKCRRISIRVTHVFSTTSTLHVSRNTDN